MSALVVVANRLPVRRSDDGSWESSPGGLVSALTPSIAARGGTWIGWSGTIGRETPPPEQDGVQIEPLTLSRRDVQGYYEGFSNRALWPLYHNAIRPSQYRPEWWARYVDVNERFAEAAARRTPAGGTVWVHDYQLQLVPAALRRRRPDLRIGFFLHIPFPPADLFRQLPGRNDLLRGLLGADLIGFQTEKAANHFGRTVADLIPEVEHTGAELLYDGRRISVRVQPISIDVECFEETAAEPEVQARSLAVRRHMGEPRNLFVGVDRLDYTKGIDLRLAAFQRLLRERPDLVPHTKLIQVAVPSREGVADYAQQRSRVERLVAEINGEFGAIDRMPVYYVHRSLGREELVALYGAADVMLVTPLCDGMNLVAKEFVVSNGRPGVLVLSEFAGAMAELSKGCVKVNPWDPEGLTDGMIRALEMPRADRLERMRAMREVVRGRDVHSWASDFLSALDRPSAGAGRRGGDVMRPVIPRERDRDREGERTRAASAAAVAFP